MKPFIVILALIAAAAVLAACGQKPAVQTQEQASFDASAQRQTAEDSLAFLQAHIPADASFGQIADAFETLCASPAAGELILFEAGTFAFGGEEAFTVSLVRQISDGGDEFFQICAEASFPPDADNCGIEETMWLDLANGDDFSAVRRSAAFTYADTHTANTVELRIDET